MFSGLCLVEELMVRGGEKKNELPVLLNPIKQFNDAGEDKMINLTARPGT